MRLSQATFNAFARGMLSALGDLRETINYVHKATASSAETVYVGLQAYVNIYTDNAIRDNPALANARRLRLAKADFAAALCDDVLGETQPSRFGTIIRTLAGVQTTWQIVTVTGDHAFWILQIQQRG